MRQWIPIGVALVTTFLSLAPASAEWPGGGDERGRVVPDLLAEGDDAHPMDLDGSFHTAFLDEDRADVATSEDLDAKADEMGLSLDELAELMANPFSYLWFGMVQNDTAWWDGDLLDTLDNDKKVMNTTLLQPVMSIQLTEDSRLIFRPAIPINSFATIKGFDIVEDENEPGGVKLTADWNRETGLGDIVLWTAYSPLYKPPFVLGFGPTIMMDTATDKWLGTGKWSAGPMVTSAYITDKWIVAGVVQHWWSFAGDGNRDDVKLTDFQPIIRYRLTTQTNIGIAPNIRVNWNESSDDQLLLPVGGGISTLIKIGPLPLGVGAEFYYYARTNKDFGPKYQLRLFFTPVLPAPAWARVPLFGKNSE